MSKMGVVRSLRRWIGCRGENRLKRVGIGIGCHCTTTKALEGLAQNRFVLPHPKNGGYTNLGYLGEL